MNSEIFFFNEDEDVDIADAERYRAWFLRVAEEEDTEIESLNYIFCSDAYLLNLNQQYLKHFDYTDVITFQYHGQGEAVAGDIFISAERVRQNASTYQVDFRTELDRVMVHGLLHLLGYADKTPDEKLLMTQKEDFYLGKK
ncbi:MAG: rRNA maturation RNase YbeY [Bacteroidota bacterium]